MSNFIDISGMRFGRLVAVERVFDPTRDIRWRCQCDCGEERIVFSQTLRGGRQVSCGCLRNETLKNRLVTHGMSKSQEHAIWRGMLARCNNPNVQAFPRYGGRGVMVCDRWKGFENFYADMGARPSPKHSLDRINTDGNYEPGNVRWVTQETQVNNRRNTRFINFRGQRMALADAVRAAGSVVHIECAAIRLKTGWDVERALTEPSKPHRRAA